MQVGAEKIAITRPSITDLEIEYVNDAIRNGWGTRCYEYINRFEREFAAYEGSRFAVATSSCTGAIHLALMAMGVKKDDEVIVPDITWIASVEPVLYIGAKPILVDVLPDTWCIDPEKVEAAITPRTKAVIVVHLYAGKPLVDQHGRYYDDRKKAWAGRFGRCCRRAGLGIPGQEGRQYRRCGGIFLSWDKNRHNRGGRNDR